MKKLYKSRTESMISGVCGGLGQYLGIDPTFIRIFFVMLAFYNFLGVWVYLIMAIFLPTAPAGIEESVEYTSFRNSPQTMKVIGGGLVLIGFLALISSLDLRIFSWLHFEIFWPFLLVLFGIVLLVRVVNQED